MEENTNPLRFETSPYHNVLIKDRKTMELSGVKQIDSFDSGEFLLETTLGWMLISGKELTLGKLDTEHGDVVIKGNIDSVSYISGKKDRTTIRCFHVCLNDPFERTDPVHPVSSAGRLDLRTLFFFSSDTDTVLSEEYVDSLIGNPFSCGFFRRHVFRSAFCERRRFQHLPGFVFHARCFFLLSLLLQAFLSLFHVRSAFFS